MSANDEYKPTGGVEGVEAPHTSDSIDNDYKSRTGQSQIPVQSDTAAIEEGIGARADNDSDAQLARDDADAIDQSNIIGDRTRGVKQNYREPGDEEGLPSDTGISDINNQ